MRRNRSKRPSATTVPQPAPTTDAATPSSEQVETDTSEAVEMVPTTSAVPTTTQPEETGSEEETVTEEEESIAASPAYIAHGAASVQFTEEYGWHDTTNSDYRECDDPEDTRALEQMKSEFYGCDFSIEFGKCSDMSLGEFTELRNRLACPEGWWLAGIVCWRQ